MLRSLPVLSCRVLQCLAVSCSVLQCLAVCCSVLQCLAVSCRDVAFRIDVAVLRVDVRNEVACSVQQMKSKCVALCCTVLSRVAVMYS